MAERKSERLRLRQHGRTRLSLAIGHYARIWDDRESGEAGLLRLRQRYREEIAHTVIFPGDIEDELRHLVALLPSNL